MPGITVTQCTVHKTLDLDSHLVMDFSYLGKRHLPRHDHPARTELLHVRRTRRAGHSHLRAGVNIHPREHASYPCKRPHILHDHRIEPLLVIRQQILIESLFQFLLLEQGVHRQIHLSAMDMCIVDGTQQFFLIKIIRICAGSKMAAAQIYRVRPRPYDRLKRLV